MVRLGRCRGRTATGGRERERGWGVRVGGGEGFDLKV